jgi:hypothetical protein
MLAAWFLYKFIFGFIIPVYRTTRQMKKKFREMHDRMQDQQVNPSDFAQKEAPPKQTAKSTGGDYIDFEELK